MGTVLDNAWDDKVLSESIKFLSDVFLRFKNDAGIVEKLSKQIDRFLTERPEAKTPINDLIREGHPKPKEVRLPFRSGDT
jgi:hypothetical protein